MTISERILKVLKDRNMTQVEFAKREGGRTVGSGRVATIIE